MSTPECGDRVHNLFDDPKEWSPKWGEGIKCLRRLAALCGKVTVSPRHACLLAKLGPEKRYRAAHVIILVPGGEKGALPIFLMPDGSLDVHPAIWDMLNDAGKAAVTEFKRGVLL